MITKLPNWRAACARIFNAPFVKQFAGTAIEDPADGRIWVRSTYVHTLGYRRRISGMRYRPGSIVSKDEADYYAR